MGVVLAGLTFASFIWAVRAYFVRDGELQAEMRLIAGGGLLTMVAQSMAFAWAPEVTEITGAAGASLYALALAVFWAAIHAHRRRPPAIAFSDSEPRQLVTGGVYAIVRHPFYFAYTLAWAGGVVATGQLWLLVSVFGMGALYYRAARQEEATFSEGHFGLPWTEYCARTPMFLPIPMILIPDFRPKPAPGGRESGDPRRRRAP
jgi:protein-S-isoprenylcysteine O-methyltransferase Ste14